MKKITALFLSLFLLAGCSSGKDAAQNKKETAFVSQDQMQQILKNDGWDVQNTTAESFHFWEQMQPTFLILAENNNKQVCLAGGFRTSEVAEAAYLSMIPVNDKHSQHQDTPQYDQVLITLDNDQGYWLVRHAGNYVFAGWMSDPNQASEYENLFTSFQQDAAAQTSQQDANAQSDQNATDQNGDDQNTDGQEEEAAQ